MSDPDRKPYPIAINRDPVEVARIQRDELRKVRVKDPVTGKRITVLRKLDPLEVLFRRHPDEFPEEIQAAARRAQRLFEIANAAGPQTLDLSRPRVDCGETEALPAARVAALDEIRRVEAEIGRRNPNADVAENPRGGETLMINENNETKEYARELRLAAKREEQNTAPSVRRPAETFDDLFVEDYSYWRTNGHDRNEALRLARSARSDRECEGEKAAAEKAKEQKAKQSARPALPRLPATSEVDEAEFLAAWDDVGPEKWQAVLPSLTFEQIRDGFLDREKVMRKMWNAAAKEFANPLVGIREFLIFHDTIIERERLIARELRVQLEKRVAALEERGVGLRFVGTYRDENVYNHGDVVSHGGSAWHTNLPTCGNKPGEGEHFTLMVKRGRDARDRK